MKLLIKTLLSALLLSSSLLANAQASLTILSPSSNDQVKFGDQVTISWLNGDLAGNDLFYFYYSVDDGNFTAINPSYRNYGQLTNSGDTSRLTWTIPDLGADSSSQVRLRILNNNQSVSDTSEYFKIYHEPKVEILQPSDTLKAKFGDQVTVKWLNGDIYGNDLYYFYYSVDDGAFSAINPQYRYYNQLTNSGDTSSFVWTIPDLGADSSSQVRFRILNHTRQVSDTIGYFKIYHEPKVEILQPSDTLKAKFGDKVTVKWLNGDIYGNDLYYFYYSVDGGAFSAINPQYRYYSQVTNSGDTSSFVWTIPDLGADSSSQVRFRILNHTRQVADTSGYFKIYHEPKVEILQPSDTLKAKFGDKVTVKWLNGDIHGNDLYYFYYSVDGGAFSAINPQYRYYSQVTNSGDTSSFVWTIPDLGADSSSQVRFRILNHTRQVSDTSGYFKIYHEPDVNILSPVNGEFILAGSQKTVKWLNGDIKGNDLYYFYYSVDGGAFSALNPQYRYYSQVTNSGDTSSFVWTTPSIQSTDVKVRILNQTRAVADTTLSFTICSDCPAVALYTPNGGEVVGVGRTVDIAWSVGTAWVGTDNIKVEYSLDGGTTYEATPIFDGSYSEITDDKISWTVPDSETTQALIKVTNVTQDASDVSDAVFSIATPPAIPTDFMSIENENGTLAFSWTDNADNETSYTVQYSTNNVNWYNYSGTLDPNTTSFTSSVIGNTAYWWRLKVANEDFINYSNTRYAGNITPFGKSLAFDGTDDMVTIGDSAVLSFSKTDAFTIEAWVKAEAFGPANIIFSKMDNAAPYKGYEFASNQDGFLRVWVESDFAAGDVIGVKTNEGLLSDYEWHHVAATYDGSSTADGVNIYVDGISVATTADYDALTGDIVNTAPAIIGARSGGYPFNGEIDEVRIWNVARSEADLLATKDTVLTGNEANLIGYYQMDHTYGNIAADNSTQNNHGEWSGASGTNTSAQWVTSEVGVDKTPIVTVLSPNGGETYGAGGTYNISWSTEFVDATDLIEIQLSTDGGENYSILADGNFGMYSGTYSWNVNATATENAVIKILNTTEGVSDTSDAVFTIEGIPESPTDVILANNNNGTYTISWTDNSQIERGFLVEASTDLTSWSTISNVGTDITQTTTSNLQYDQNYFIRVSAKGLGANSDPSDHQLISTFIAPGNAIVLDNTDNINAGASPVTSTNPFSISIWFKTEKNSGGQVLVTTRGTVTNAYTNIYYLGLTADGRVQFATGTAETANSLFSLKTGLNDGYWHHTVAVRESGGELKVYVDGELDNSKTQSNYSISAYAITLGRNVRDGGAQFVGQLDEFSLWNTALVADSISANWLSAASSWGNSENLVRYLDFDQSDGSSVFERTGLGNDPTINGTVEWNTSAALNAPAYPLLTVTSPNGGEIWNIAENQTITWTTENIPSTDLIEIRLSTDSGETYSMIQDGTFGMYNGSYTWTVSGDESNTALIQVANTTQSVSDESDEVFTIGAQAQSITVTAPNGQEVLNGNQAFDITWTTINIPDNDPISIQLSLNGGDYEEIASGTFGDFAGSYNWTVPDTTSTSTWIKILDTASEVFDTNNSRFTILENPKISLTSPNGGEQWEVGTSQQIRWDFASFGSGDIVEVSLSTDGGETFDVWLSGNYQNGFVNVEVPDQVTETAVLKVKNLQKEVEDISDAPFTIYKVNRSISIISPAGGETFAVGQEVTVDFELEGLDSNDIMDFYISTDGGNTFPYRVREAFVSSAGDSTFTWIVNQPASDNAVMRARVTTRGLEFVTEPFTINAAPIFGEIDAEIIGDQIGLQYALNEVGTVYMATLEIGNAAPTGDQVKLAATGEQSLEGQVLVGNWEYPKADSIVNLTENSPFTRQAYYNVYLSAEDVDGNLSGAVLIGNILAQFTPLEKDSIAVDQLYLNMGGAEWTNLADNWIELPLAEREEITIENERITGLNLADHSIMGAVDYAILGLDSLKTLDLSSNSISTLIELTSLSALTSLDVSNNHLQFGDLELNAELLSEPEQYSPQANYGNADSLALPQGSMHTLSNSVTGSNNSYKWFVDLYNTYEVEFTEIANATQNRYLIQSLDYDNMGTYYTEVTNELLPGLTLTSEPVQVWATANLTITALGKNNQPLTSGAAYALRNLGPGLPYDSIPKEANGTGDPKGLILSNGRANFENLLLGDYLIAVRSDPTQYLPTYYESTYLWEEAEELAFREDLNQSLRMYALPPPLGPNDGSGRVTGAIESNFTDPSLRTLARKKVKRAACSMRRYTGSGRSLEEDPNWELVAYVESDDEGVFTFEYIPEGLYRLNIEYPGIPMDPDSYVEFQVGPEGSSNGVVELKAEITETGIAVIRTNPLYYPKAQLEQFSVYPNPAIDRVNLRIGDEFEKLAVYFSDMNGKVIEIREQLVADEVSFEASDLPTGMYYLRIVTKDKPSEYVTYKFYIRH